MAPAIEEAGPVFGRAVAVLGLGFVGLPLALSFALAGSQVFGVDIRPDHIQDLQTGRSTLGESCDGRSLPDILQEVLGDGRFTPTKDAASAIGQADTVVITVGVPVAEGVPRPDELTQALETVGDALKPGQLVLLRATVVPGTTSRLALPVLEKRSGLKADRDFYLAYCPERMAEGRAFDELRTMPVIVAGIGPRAATAAQAAMRRITDAPIRVGSSVLAVELSKVVENVQRDANIAIVQELARACERAGMDTRDVIELANTHTRVHLLEPGAGVGGFCLPNAFAYLQAWAGPLGVALPTLEAARQTNSLVPAHIVSVAIEHLKRLGLRPERARTAIWGLAMKDHSDDARLSPALVVADRLAAAGVEVNTYDPTITSDRARPCGSALEAARGAHVLLVLALQDHMGEPVDALPSVLAPGALVIDTRGLYRRERERMGPLGLSYWAI